MATAIAFVAATAGFAHDTWIAARESAPPAGTTVVMDVTSGMAFPELDYAIKAERIARARVRVGRSVVDVTDLRSGAKSLELRFSAPSAGLGTVWVDLAPKSLELEAAEVRHYLEEIGANETVGREWSARKGRRVWRETYTKHAKTFVRIGGAVGDSSWSEPVGAVLEIVPETDPTALRAGGVLSVRVLKDGKPFAGFKVAAVPAGAKTADLKTTDADGRVTFVLDRPGGWLVRGTDLYASPSRRGEWESHFATLTLVVGTR